MELTEGTATILDRRLSLTEFILTFTGGGTKGTATILDRHLSLTEEFILSFTGGGPREQLPSYIYVYPSQRSLS